MYFDTSYIAKFYFNEPKSLRVRELVRKADAIYSSLWALAEFRAVLHRRLREGVTSPSDARDLASRFSEHIEDGLWNLIPVGEALLRRASALMVSAPRDLFLRTADAVHLTTAHEIREPDVWTNDRHMLATTRCIKSPGAAISYAHAPGLPACSPRLHRGYFGVNTTSPMDTWPTTGLLRFAPP